VKDLSEAIRLNPSGDHLYDARAKGYVALYEYKKALADLNEAIRLAPNVAAHYNDRGCVYTFLDNYPKGYEQFQEAIRLDPKFALANSNRAVSRHAEKQYGQAMADFNKALDIDPKLSHAYSYRGLTWCKTGHYAQGLKDWDESIRLTPDECWGYYNKARMFATCESLGHRDGPMALEYAMKACEVAHWEEWRCVATLAAAYAELGQFDDAVRWQKKAITMNKNPEEHDRRDQEERLKLYEAGMPFRDPELSQ
jgi:tetratricopeptide (TPR) repeat protein